MFRHGAANVKRVVEPSRDARAPACASTRPARAGVGVEACRGEPLVIIKSSGGRNRDAEIRK
jgi:hypothetical protein